MHDLAAPKVSQTGPSFQGVQQGADISLRRRSLKRIKATLTFDRFFLFAFCSSHSSTDVRTFDLQGRHTDHLRSTNDNHFPGTGYGTAIRHLDVAVPVVPAPFAVAIVGGSVGAPPPSWYCEEASPFCLMDRP
jgi:hypothetical protein